MTHKLKHNNLCVWVPYISNYGGSDVSNRTIAEGLTKAGVKVYLQSFHYYFEFAPWLLSRKKAPPSTSIILANSWYGFAFARPGCRLVTVDRLCVHDPVLEPYKKFGQRIFHNQLIKRYVVASAKQADTTVAVSHYTADLYPQELGLPRPLVITNAVDTDFFVPAPNGKPSLRGRKVKLLFVGNLIARKGVDMFAPIMQRLGPGYELYYTAGLRTRDMLEKSKNMYPLGKLDQAQILKEYQKADLLLFPSRGEGLPRAVMEALACGTPVVASRVSSLPEAIDEKVGELCPMDDVDAFVQAIKRLTNDQDQLVKFSENARSRALERFSLTRMIQEYIDLFQRII